MPLTYRFTTPVYPAEILYINCIPQYSCTNDCLFCSRPRHAPTENIYEKKAGTSLHLAQQPTVDEIIRAIEINIRPTDKEIAFVGLGEPLQYLPTVVEVLKYIKKRHNVKTRVDTNGTATCTYPDAAAQLASYLDEIRISVNATNAEDYRKLCRPRHPNAFEHVVSFVQQCRTAGIDTYASFVVGFELSKTEEEYKKFAESLGVNEKHILLRKYVKSIE
jgi:TatD family-associated radical SAM protein